MTHNIAQSLARSQRGLVVAPAGCGKTRLIADAVNYDQDRQLVLTHTHAGVRAILNHLNTVGVSLSRVRVTTIDSFALRYANAFPNLSGWRTREPTGDQWLEIHTAAERAFQCRAVRHVLRATYRGIYVDEYQDCSAGQHALVTTLAGILPCRILGDPLQAIFRQVHKDAFLNWSLAEAEFEKIAEPSTPHRWRGCNEGLGEWLLDVRRRMQTGAEIDLQHPCLEWQSQTNEPDQLAACKRLLSRKRENVVAVRQWRPQCYKLAGKLGNAYISMETVECEDLQDWCDRIEGASDVARVETVAQFAEDCLTRLPSDVRAYPHKIRNKGRLNPQRPDRKTLLVQMREVAQDNDLGAVDRLLAAYMDLNEKPVFKRRELWSEMRKAVHRHRGITGRTLRETAWSLRETARRIGRAVPHHCISTTLLVKGLQFDHAVILNLKDFQDAENAYVAMTRGAYSLTILSDSPKVRFERPYHSK